MNMVGITLTNFSEKWTVSDDRWLFVRSPYESI